jgi:hypothetical protein
MDSEAYAALRAVAADPWLWIGAAALFLGVALGQAARAIIPERKKSARSGRRRSRRIARAVAFLSLAILFATGILIFSTKDALEPGIFPLEALAPYAAAAGLGGVLAGLFPLAGGLPLAALALASVLAFRAGIDGWTLYREAGTVARLLPYEVGPASFRGELEVAGPGAAAGAHPASAAAGSASICVDALEFSGPLGLAARILGPGRGQGWYEGSRRFYRVAALVAPGAAPSFLDPPARQRWVDALLPLPEGAGLEPGGALARSEALGSLATRYRSSGPGRALVALESVYYDLDEDRAPRISARQAPTPGWDAKQARSDQ